MQSESKKKLAFVGGKQIGADCLKYLLEKNIFPQLIIANLDDNGRNTWHESLVKIAQRAKLLTVKKKRVSDPEIIERIKKIDPEIIFCIGGTQLIPREVLNIPKLGCINIHPALLPKYRGRFSTVHAIANGEKYTGVTIHWMNQSIDSGPIIMQERFPIDKNDTAKSLYDKFTKVGLKLFKEFVRIWLTSQKIPSIAQNETKSSYYPKGLPNEGQINWSWSGKRIRDFIRSMTFEPFPPAEFTIGNKKMVVVDKKYFKGFK